MAGIIFSIIAGASMSIQGVMNTRLSDKIGIYEFKRICSGNGIFIVAYCGVDNGQRQF